MWDRMLEGKSYSEKNLIDVINKTAKIKGYVDADDMAIIPILKGEDEPSWEGDETDIPSPTKVERTAAMEDINIVPRVEYEPSWEGDEPDTPSPTRVEETAAMEDIITPPPAPVHHPHVGMNGGVNGGNGGYGGDPGGGTAGSPFFRGGRIDKALTGRSRDI